MATGLWDPILSLSAVGRGAVSVVAVRADMSHCGWRTFTAILFPGCVKLGEKIVFCVPTAGRITQFSYPYSRNLGSSF